MITPDKLRQVLNQTSLLNAYSEFQKKYMLRAEAPEIKTMKCLSSENDADTVKLIKKVLSGDPKKNENLIIGECFYFVSEHELGKEKYFVKGIARCAELKKGFLSSSLEGLILLFVTYPRDFEYFLKERRALGLPEAVGLDREIPVKYILNAPVSAYLD